MRVIVRRPWPDTLNVVAARLAALPTRALARAGVRRAVLYERRLDHSVVPPLSATRAVRIRAGV
jgi:hypothetical protein